MIVATGKLVLDAIARLGELLENRTTKKETIKMPDGSIRGTIGDLPDGIDKKFSHYAQEFYCRYNQVLLKLFKMEFFPL